jgi:HAD superfamily hydrolase (TIGR01509 family)
LGLSEVAAVALSACRHWVFDLDGTLTLAVHDFALIRRELEIPEGHDILGYLSGLPAAEAAAKRAWLIAHERELADASVAAPGAVELLRSLHARGCALGILTRNDHALARLTLAEIGVGDLFPQDAIIGRDEAIPKPHPAGLQLHAARWGVSPRDLVMVGDHGYDLEAGRAAGARTVFVGADNRWSQLSDHAFGDCGRLLEALESESPVTSAR